MGGDLVGLEPPTSGLELGWYVQQDEWEGHGFCREADEACSPSSCSTSLGAWASA